MAPIVGKRSLLDILDPGAIDADRHLVFAFAGNRAGVAANALAIVNQKAKGRHGELAVRKLPSSASRAAWTARRPCEMGERGVTWGSVLPGGNRRALYVKMWELLLQVATGYQHRDFQGAFKTSLSCHDSSNNEPTSKFRVRSKSGRYPSPSVLRSARLKDIVTRYTTD